MAEHWNEFMNNPSFEDALSRVISEDMSLSEKLICVWDETVNQWTAENLDFAGIKFEFWLESSKMKLSEKNERKGKEQLKHRGRDYL